MFLARSDSVSSNEVLATRSRVHLWASLLVENRHRLIDEDSGQPAAKSPFMFKPLSATGGGP
jgi:hypothetical protein